LLCEVSDRVSFDKVTILIIGLEQLLVRVVRSDAV
jgi:hypothetical protein